MSPTITNPKTLASGRFAWLRRFTPDIAAYALALILCCAGTACLLELWNADLSIPFGYRGDELLTQVWAKSVYDHGWNLYNPSLSAPTTMDMLDFPSSDSLHLFVIKLLSYVTPSYVEAYNIYFLLTFPLTTITTLYVFRKFGVGYAAAIAGSLLFTFHTHHFLRGVAHLFLASYFMVPLAVMVVLWIYLDRISLSDVNDSSLADAKSRRRRVLASIMICAVQSSAGVYYAFFSCFMMLVAGIASAFHRKRFYPLRIALLLVAVTTAGVLANTSPYLLYVREYGKNGQVGNRHWSHAEVLGLKISHLVLPVPGHRVPTLARLRQRYDAAAPFPNESILAALGTCASVGFGILICHALLRRSSAPETQIMDGISVLNICTVLLATVGGYGVLFNLFITAQIRAYNRISIYLAFFAFLAVCLLLQRLGNWRASRGWPAWRFHALLAIIVVLGTLDQVPGHYAARHMNYADVHARWQNDATFFGQIEAALPEGAMVAQFPYMSYPESPPVGNVHDNDHARGYLHSKTLRWTYGILLGRPADAWMRRVMERPLLEQIRIMAVSGFGGICVDRHGYVDRGAELENMLIHELNSPPLESNDKSLAFFPFQEYGRNLMQSLPSDERRRYRKASWQPVSVYWSNFDNEEVTPHVRLRWCRGENAGFCLDNRSASNYRVTMKFTIVTAREHPATLHLQGPDLDEMFAVGSEPREIVRDVKVPPGRVHFTFQCDAKPLVTPQRSVTFRICDFEHEVIDPQEMAINPAGPNRR